MNNTYPEEEVVISTPVTINGKHLECFAPDDILTLKYYLKQPFLVNALPEDIKAMINLILKTYQALQYMSCELGILCPYFSMSDEKSYFPVGAEIFQPSAYKELPNNIIILYPDTNLLYHYYYITDCAQKMRKLYHETLLFRPTKKQADIDSDAYAIYYLSSVEHISLEKATDFVCLHRKINKKVRLKRARKLFSYYTNSVYSGIKTYEKTYAAIRKCWCWNSQRGLGLPPQFIRH